MPIELYRNGKAGLMPITPDTMHAHLMCEGPCSRPTLHDYAETQHVFPKVDGRLPDRVDFLFAFLFACRACGVARRWGIEG